MTASALDLVKALIAFDTTSRDSNLKLLDWVRDFLADHGVFSTYTFDDERRKAITKLGKNAEITRFKGLGEISPDEFGFMIGPDMRLDHVEYEEGKGVKELLAFYMGKNTPDRQDFIIANLREDVDKQVEVAVA